jgi:hypothetical protein
MPPLQLFTLWLLQLATAKVKLGQRLSFSRTQWVQVFGLGKLQELRTQGIQNHHGEGEAVGAAVDAVYQDAFADGRAVRLQLERQVGIGHLPGLPQFLDELFSPSLVKRAGFHFPQSCMIFNARILKAFKAKTTHASNSMYAYKPGQFTAGH